MNKVYNASKLLNYKPNVLASSLVTKTTNIIGIFLRYDEPPINNSTYEIYAQLYGSLIIGFSVKAAEFGLKPLVYITMDDVNNNFGNLLLTHSEPIDGAVVMTPHLHDTRIDELIEANIPFVLIGQPGTKSTNVPRIDADNFRIVFDLTEKLIKLGHRDIALINSNPNFTITYDRLNGYKKALETYDIIYNEALAYQIETTFEDGIVAAESLVSSGNKFTAAIIQSSLTCSAFYSVFKKYEINIPDDVSIISLGGDPTPFKLDPPPSLIDINYYEIGIKAAQIIYDRLNNNLEQYEEFIDYTFIEGKSTKSLL
jgi:DNA-binding LacI/PurR family transcriptional regulator